MGTDRGRAAIFFGLYAAVLLYSLYWMHLSHVSKRVAHYPWLHTLIGLALVYVAVRAWLVITERVGQSWEPLWITLDLVIITGVVRLTGGIESEAALVYFWPIGIYAILRRTRGTALVGIAVGVCYVLATWPREVTPDYADKLGSRLFVLALVTIVATAFSVREVQRVEEIARLREQVALGAYRRQLSQEMHDGIQHYLVVIAMRLEWARRLLEREPARAAALAVDQRVVVRQAADELHHLVRRLRSPALERQGFVDALRDHVAMFAERTEMVAPLRVCGEPRTLPPDVEQAAFRIIQEALTNVEKHAHATSATVELDFRAGRLRWVVEDNGAGYDPEAVAPHHRATASTTPTGILPSGILTHRRGCEGGSFNASPPLAVRNAQQGGHGRFGDLGAPHPLAADDAVRGPPFPQHHKSVRFDCVTLDASAASGTRDTVPPPSDGHTLTVSPVSLER